MIRRDFERWRLITNGGFFFSADERPIVIKDELLLFPERTRKLIAA